MAQNEKWRRIPRALIDIQLILVLFLFGARDALGLPDKVKYLFDIVVIALIPMCCYEIVLRIGTKRFFRDVLGYAVTAALCIFSGAVILSALLNRVPLRLFLWASRNTYRYIVFFIACILFLDGEDVRRFWKSIDVLYILNFLLVLIQFVILGNRNDYVGGLFGMEVPCNTYLNIFLCIALTVAACEFMEHKRSQISFAFVALSSMVITAMAELKVFYLEYALILFLILIFYRRSDRKYWLVFYGGLGLILGMGLLYVWYPKHFEIMTDSEVAKRYLTRSEEDFRTYYIARIGAFKVINKLFLGDSLRNQLIGLGFGNCEGSSMALFTSDFYIQNGWTKYRWFVHQMLYLETGYLGFFTFLGIFAVLALDAWKMLRKTSQNRGYLITAIVFCVIILANMWYNYGIRNEIAYLSYFFLAIPRIMHRD